MKYNSRSVYCIFFLLFFLFAMAEAWGSPTGALDEWDTSPLRPYDIVVLPDGSVWLNFYEMAMSDDGKVFTIDPSDGSFTEFDAPFEARFGTMDQAPGNALWITDHHHRLVHFDTASGAFTAYELPGDIFSVPETLAEHMGVSVAPDGKVWFTYWSDPCLGVFDPATETWQRFPLPAGGDHAPGVPVEIAFGPDETVWFTIKQWASGKAGLGKLDPHTGDLNLWTDPDFFPTDCFPYGGRPLNPWGIAVVDGIIWFVDHSSSCLLKYDPLHPGDGFRCFRMPLEEGTVWDAHYFVVDADGVFWLTAFGIDALGTFDPETETFDRLMLTDGAFPMGISISPMGHLWWAETFSRGQGGVGRFRPFPRLPSIHPEPRWIPERPLRKLNLIDCGPCPHCFDRPCDPRINLDNDRFIVWDPSDDIIGTFSLLKLGLKPDEEGPLAAAAPLKVPKVQMTFVASAPNAKGGAGSVLFFNKAGETTVRIDGRLPGERLGLEMDVKGDEIVVASTQRLLRLKGQKVAFEMSFPPELFAQRGVHVSFTADMDGDNRADILLGTPYAKVGRNSEAGQIQLIGSSSGKVLFVVQGRTRGEHMGEVLQPLDLSFGQRKN